MPLSESRQNLIDDITRKIYFKRKRTKPYSEIQTLVVHHLADRPIIQKQDIQRVEDQLGRFTPELPHSMYQLNLQRSAKGENAREQYQQRMYDMDSLRSSKKEKQSPDYCIKTLERIKFSPQQSRNYFSSSNDPKSTKQFQKLNQESNLDHYQSLQLKTPMKRHVQFLQQHSNSSYIEDSYRDFSFQKDTPSKFRNLQKHSSELQLPRPFLTRNLQLSGHQPQLFRDTVEPDRFQTRTTNKLSSEYRKNFANASTNHNIQLAQNVLERDLLRVELNNHKKEERRHTLMRIHLARSNAKEQVTNANSQHMISYMSKQEEKTSALQQHVQEMIPFNRNQQRYIDQLKNKLQKQALYLVQRQKYGKEVTF